MRKTLVKIHLSGSHLVIEPVCRGIDMRRDFCLSLEAWKQLNRKEGRVIARNNNSFADFQVISALDLLRIDFFWLNTLESGAPVRRCEYSRWEAGTVRPSQPPLSSLGAKAVR